MLLRSLEISFINISVSPNYIYIKTQVIHYRVASDQKIFAGGKTDFVFLYDAGVYSIIHKRTYTSFFFATFYQTPKSNMRL